MVIPAVKAIVHLFAHAGPGACGSVYWKGKNNTNAYRAHYLEFHTPSEHTIDMVGWGSAFTMFLVLKCTLLQMHMHMFETILFRRRDGTRHYTW